jgi:predicted acyltransferase
VKDRLVSLDVLRGLTIILMTIVNNPGDWATIYPPLRHAEWHGCTPTDLVFPTFLFIVGVSVVLAIPVKRWDEITLQKIVIRTLRIFCLGWFLSFFGKIQLFGLDGIPLLLGRLVITAVVVVALFSDYPRKRQLGAAFAIFAAMLVLAYGGFQDFQDVRIPGVLQRIAVIYFVVSLLYLRTSWVVQALVAGVLLVLYWGLMTLIPVPGVGDANLEKGTNLAAWLDNRLLGGHLWAAAKTWDPEGILSTLPAIGTGIAGLLTGTWLISAVPTGRKAIGLFVGAIVGIFIGLAWDVVFPINKVLWTSSYVLYAAGIVLLALAILYFLVDVKGYKGWTEFFVIFGVNPMIVFFFSGIIPRVMSAIQISPGDTTEALGLQSYLYRYHILPKFAEPMDASLAYALGYLAFWFIVLYILYRNKLVFKV